MNHDWTKFYETYKPYLDEEPSLHPPMLSPPRPMMMTPPRHQWKNSPRPVVTPATPKTPPRPWTNKPATFVYHSQQKTPTMSDVASAMSKLALGRPEPAHIHVREDYEGFNFLNMIIGVPFVDEVVNGLYYSGMSFYAGPLLAEALMMKCVKLYFHREDDEIIGIYVKTAFPEMLFKNGAEILHSDPKDPNKVPYPKIKSDHKVFWNGIATTEQFQTSNLLIKFPDGEGSRRFCADHFHEGTRNDELKHSIKSIGRKISTKQGNSVDRKDAMIMAHVAFAENPRRSTRDDTIDKDAEDALDDLLG